MENLKTKVQNTKDILIELINLLESNSISADSLKKTYVMLEITKDEEKLEQLVIGVSKLIENTTNELEITTNKIKKVKYKASEKIENYNDSKESEKLINNI